MVSLKTILAGIRQNNFMVSIDLTEAYIHVPIFPGHRKFLRFSYLGRHYQYRDIAV